MMRLHVWGRDFEFDRETDRWHPVVPDVDDRRVGAPTLDALMLSIVPPSMAYIPDLRRWQAGELAVQLSGTLIVEEEPEPPLREGEVY